MDILFPLSYTTYGSVKLGEDETELAMSHVQHLLETIEGERSLFQFFGFPPDALFQTPVPPILAERIRLLILNNIGLSCKCEINFKGGRAAALVYINGTALEIILG